MTTPSATTPPAATPPPPTDASQGFAFGTMIVAAILLITAGTVSLLQGIAALVSNDLYFVGVNYVYSFNLTAWGWIHIGIGVVAVLVSLGLFAGADWARALAVVIAALSIIANFLWLPYYPLWSILIIALDVVVIWAVTTWHQEKAYY